MIFHMPHFPGQFEIPDEWLAEAGFSDFQPDREAFQSTSDATVLPLTEIEPVARFRAHPLDGNGFCRPRLVSVLKGIISKIVIPPVPIVELPFIDRNPSPYKYRVRDGFHRFYASVAAGFQGLPVTHD